MSSNSLHTAHQRSFEKNRFVYPVLSRRSAGMSLGVNLNPDKVCNFDCIYCQVDRTSTSETRFVEMDRLLDELDSMLDLILSGHIYETPAFQSVPRHLRRLNDIAFSGDGEPTTFRNFDEIVLKCAQMKQQHTAGTDPVKLVLITNASMFHRKHIQLGLDVMDQHQGEIWAKLDAGTADYYDLIERTSISFQQVLDNILLAARKRPLVIQSLFMKVHGNAPGHDEIEAYCRQLNHITEQGGAISRVQIYTIARRPAESFVTPLADESVDGIVNQVIRETGLMTEGYYGYEI
ncbi:MAG: radical SAM protein [Planctomycetota bacterium]|nr:radical SAM protein [Planctomycetota bacterium]